MVNVQSGAQKDSAKPDFDAIIIGAGFSGMYMLHSLRDKLGLKVTVFEAGNNVGGTWYWTAIPAHAAIPTAISIVTHSISICCRNGIGPSAIQSKTRSCGTLSIAPSAST